VPWVPLGIEFHPFLAERRPLLRSPSWTGKTSLSSRARDDLRKFPRIVFFLLLAAIPRTTQAAQGGKTRWFSWTYSIRRDTEAHRSLNEEIVGGLCL